jgi:hypothetical protein
MSRFGVTVVIVVLAAAVPRVSGQARAERVVVPLSDPSRPATLDVGVYAGIINVRAGEARQIVIEAAAPIYLEQSRGAGDKRPLPPRPPARDASGLTRLTPPSALDIDEANNVVTVRGAAGARIDLTMRVPRRTSFRLKKTAVGSTLGTVTVQGIEGDHEIHTEGGAVTLNDVSGSVVAHSGNSSVIASLTRLTPDRPMAFTSYSGNVDVTLPRSVRATFLLQSDRGDIFSGFQPLRDGARSGSFRRGKGQPLRLDVNGGGPEFELRTFAGNVYLRTAN